MGESVALDGRATTTLPEVHHLTDKGTADNPLRVSLVGLGSTGRHHAQVIRATESMELMAVADPGNNRLGVTGELPVLPDVHTLVDAGFDAVMVTVPTVYHGGIALALTEVGVHTMVEKPTTHDTATGRRVATAFAERGLVGVVGYAGRCSPALRVLRERLGAGELDEVYQVLTHRQGPFPARISDIGVIKDLAIHDIDLTVWVADARYASVAAQVTHRSGRQDENMMVATGLLKGGIVVSHQVSWLTPFKEHVTIVIDGKGAFVADTLTRSLTFHANSTMASTWDQVATPQGVGEGDVIRYTTPKRGPLALEQKDFRDAVHGMTQRHVTMTEGVATFDVVEAVLALASENRMVTL